MRKWVFEKLQTLALKHHKRVLIITFILTLIMAGFAGTLKMNFRWTDLLPEDFPFVREYTRIQEDHNDYSLLIVLISGENRERMTQAADDAGAAIAKRTEYIKDVDIKLPFNFLEKHGFMTLKPKDARRISRIYGDPNLPELLAHFNDDLEKTYIGGEDDLQENENEVVASLESTTEALGKIYEYLGSDNPDKKTVLDIARDFTFGDGYYTSLDGKTIMILASCTPDIVINAEKYADVAYAAEADLQPVIAKYQDLKIEMTGMTPIGKDEMESVGTYTYILSMVALALVLILLIFSFRIVSAPILILIPLIVGIVWDLAITAIFIGYLNMFTAVISMVLIGIGIDFAIHLMSRYSEVRSHGKPLEAALSEALSKSGAGVITGGLTTAIAFLTLMVAETKGIAEFGFTAGIGIILALIAVFLILPSLIVMRENRLQKKDRHPIPVKVEYKFLGSIGKIIVKQPLLILVIFLILTGLLYWQSKKIGWEYNMLDLEPKGLRSVELYDNIIDDFGYSSSLSFTTANSLDEARKYTDEFKKKKAVGQVESITEIIRSDKEQAETSEILERTIPLLRKTRLETSKPEVLKKKLTEELERLEMNLIELGDLANIGGQDRIDTKVMSILKADKDGNPSPDAITRKLISTLSSTPGEKIENLNREFFPVMRDRLIEMSNPQKISEADLPASLLDKYKSEKTGTYMINIFPKEDTFNKESLDRFLAQVNPVKENVTGMPQLTMALIDTTVKDGKITILAALYVIMFILLLDFSQKSFSFRIIASVIGAAVLIAGLHGLFPLGFIFLIFIPLLFIDPKGIGYVTMSLLPIISGFIWMLGIMGLVGMDYNYINIMALPIILGIGIDDGVHLLHRYRESKTHDLPHILTWVGKAILLTSLTTMIGFGSIAFYTHIGMATMGIVLFVGVGACFLTTLFILTPVIQIWHKFSLKKTN